MITEEIIKEALALHNKAVELGLIMQKAIPDEYDNAIILGMATQKMSSFCAIQMHLPLDKYLESCAMSYKLVFKEMNEQKSE
jgi:hypothetical protein